MQVTFYIDPDTQLPHLYNHGVTEQEVVELFRRFPQRLHGKRGAMIALGQTDAGRYLKVIYREVRTGLFVITAYDLQGKALKAYRRRRRRRGQ